MKSGIFSLFNIIVFSLLLVSACSSSDSSSDSSSTTITVTLALDEDFGSEGYATLDEASTAEAGNAVMQLADGSIVVAGYQENATKDIYLAKFTSAGVLDTTFGTDGVAVFNYGGEDIGLKLVESGSNIIVLASSDDYLLVAAVDSTTGALDGAFGASGYYYNVSYTNPVDIGVQSDDTIVVLAQSGTTDLVVLRLDGTNGTVSSTTTLDYNSQDDVPGDLSIASDDSILVTGTTTGDYDYSYVFGKVVTSDGSSSSDPTPNLLELRKHAFFAGSDVLDSGELITAGTFTNDSGEKIFSVGAFNDDDMSLDDFWSDSEEVIYSFSSGGTGSDDSYDTVPTNMYVSTDTDGSYIIKAGIRYVPSDDEEIMYYHEYKIGTSDGAYLLRMPISAPDDFDECVTGSIGIQSDTDTLLVGTCNVTDSTDTAIVLVRIPEIVEN